MIALEWTRVGPPMAAAFLGSLVECIEALTVVLAVATVRGWRSALLGAGAGAAFLAALICALGPALGAVPMARLQLGVGVLLVLFGMRWLRKAILRAAGLIALHDEAQTYARQSGALRAHRGARDWIAIATAFKAVVLEGLEVVFIVVAVGAAGRLLVPAGAGAAAAALLVIGAGLALHRPLARAPENLLKFAVGILLSAFGVFWAGEGLGFPWPGADLSILGLAGGLLLTALVLVPALGAGGAGKEGIAHG